ncbi:hypothetical protein GQ44DRAFT_703061 [Phaeosphaeriaceae sp. PMI808]|nr:hypothetical protein GQ44DRAFT_703061 [Phaeosphaeriaceae sp. PMI808]
MMIELRLFGLLCFAVMGNCIWGRVKGVFEGEEARALVALDHTRSTQTHGRAFQINNRAHFLFGQRRLVRASQSATGTHFASLKLLFAFP